MINGGHELLIPEFSANLAAWYGLHSLHLWDASILHAMFRYLLLLFCLLGELLYTTRAFLGILPKSGGVLSSGALHLRQVE